jgi:hypothetical protein
MGCDGGTIPKRDELVRKKKKPEQVSVVDLLVCHFRVVIGGIEKCVFISSICFLFTER